MTVDCSARKPRSTWSGVHGLSASFSAITYESLPGWPSVPRSSVPGMEPQTLRITRRTARPIVRLARQPGPKRLSPALMSSARAIGPLTIMSTAAPAVDVPGPW